MIPKQQSQRQFYYAISSQIPNLLLPLLGRRRLSSSGNDPVESYRWIVDRLGPNAGTGRLDASRQGESLEPDIHHALLLVGGHGSGVPMAVSGRYGRRRGEENGGLVFAEAAGRRVD